MAYIYVITNDINGKQYVGKTNWTIEKRFQEHINDCTKRNLEKRPLYDAMNKYGIEHFSIKELERCSEKEASNKEIYWIGKLDTYKNGYNATLGGDGKVLYDYKELANAYLELKKIKDVCEKFHCDSSVVKKACQEYDITITSGQEWAKKNGKKVAMIDINSNEVIRTFATLREAGIFLGDATKSKHIGKVCNGKRQVAYGYRWKYI